jgi:Bacteriophage Mu Gam like protein
MVLMEEIERLTEAYASARAALGERIETIHEEMAAVRKKHMARLRTLAAKAAEARSALNASIDQSQALFVKPRTRILHGVKIGIVKGKGKIVVDDEARTIQLIRKHMNEQTAETLIRVRESLNKAALDGLDAADLKRIGVRITDAGDEVVIKGMDGDVEKLVDALLEKTGDSQRLENEAA